MSKKNQPGNTKAEWKGDTGRTSSQGRKLASGGDANKKGAPEIDEATQTPVSQIKKGNKQ